jgi:hypothetical protein
VNQPPTKSLEPLGSHRSPRSPFESSAAVAVIAFAIAFLRGALVDGVSLAFIGGSIAAVVAGGTHAAARALCRRASAQRSSP